MVLVKLDSTLKRMKLDPYLTPSAKMDSKWNQDLTIRAKTVKLLKDTKEVNLGIRVLYIIQTTKEKIDQLDFIHI